MTTNQIRKKFIDFFVSKEHKKLLPSSVVSKDDQSVLFTSAGMQQFKKFYNHPEDAPAKRVVTSQSCVRTTDIDEVGDSSHLTLFEMLGNFSFGYRDIQPSTSNNQHPTLLHQSYFKREAIEMAWEFLTSKKWLGVDKKRIYVTYFKGCGQRKIIEDNESLKILGTLMPKGLEKIKPQGFGDNFWTLGVEDSPGGPTVEFYIDGVEIWNLVFNEYLIKNGQYEPAKFKGVDTGMGLERMTMAINGAKSVFKTDIFAPIMEKIERLSSDKKDIKMSRVIADHLRAAVQIAGEGIEPSNRDQGYILRRLIRRAATYKNIIGIETSLTDIMDMSQVSKQIIAREENVFNKTLNRGLKILNNILERNIKEVSGAEAFDMFQTFGFPLEITKKFAKKKGIKIDEKGFKAELKKHQELSRKSLNRKFKGGLAEQSEIAMKYHTATHLLRSALRQVLGDHILQRGSNITAERLRFDFSQDKKMTSEQIAQVENLVNQYILANCQVKKEKMSLSEAKKIGAIGIFDEKYGTKVSVYTIGDDKKTISKEICGGPHVEQTGILGKFKITKEQSSSSGVRRIKATLE